MSYLIIALFCASSLSRPGKSSDDVLDRVFHWVRYHFAPYSRFPGSKPACYPETLANVADFYGRYAYSGSPYKLIAPERNGAGSGFFATR